MTEDTLYVKEREVSLRLTRSTCSDAVVVFEKTSETSFCPKAVAT